MGVIILKNKQIVEVCVQYLSSAEYIGAQYLFNNIHATVASNMFC